MTGGFGEPRSLQRCRWQVAGGAKNNTGRPRPAKVGPQTFFDARTTRGDIFFLSTEPTLDSHKTARDRRARQRTEHSAITPEISTQRALSACLTVQSCLGHDCQSPVANRQSRLSNAKCPPPRARRNAPKTGDPVAPPDAPARLFPARRSPERVMGAIFNDQCNGVAVPDADDRPSRVCWDATCLNTDTTN